MALLTTAEAKEQIGIAAEETIWDALLAGYIAAAERACEIRTGRSIDPDAAPIDSIAASFTAADLDLLKHAVRLIVSDWFANRESTNVGNSTSPMPLGVEFIFALLTDYGDR